MILFLFILLIFLIISLKSIEHFTENKIACIYAYYEKNDLYKNNFKYFLENGIIDTVDYYIVINGNHTINIPIKNNIKIIKRDNKGFDFGAYSYVINNIKEYNYYFFLNTSVKGPILENNNKLWIDYFIELFNKPDIKLVGTSINIFNNENSELEEIYKHKNPFIHIQSMFFVIDNEYYKYLKKINFFNEEEINKYDNIFDVIFNKEIGLSQHALKNGWNINCILSKYQNIDYRTLKYDINTSSNEGDPYYENSYFGSTIQPKEVIFYKNNRNF
jgi:hypothetical protein